MQIIDTHLHLMYPDTLRYAWAASVPELQGAATVEMFETLARPLGIERALMMEVDVDEPDIEAEIDVVGALVARTDTCVEGMIAACRPERPGTAFAAFVERLAARPHVKGVRRVLHTSPDTLSASQTFSDNLNRLAAQGLSFDLCVLARQLRGVAVPLAQRCPDLSIVLDHCGVPDIAGGALDAWRADLRAIAALPNVSCKISGIVAYAGAGWTVETLRPYFEHVIACFGWERVVWGSDWPVCRLGGDLARWVDATHALLHGCSADEQAALLNRNAQRLYRLGSASGV
ncbi:amidohydrolase family protein [Pararobbsia silviterrae]|uniref:Amidohydrolase n=1 Tax=Pararobbsia silviterrae TaxID=1792498 RepID=A0A494XW82_9BURK|nr:amidohydrolase [Pararobbsia silviterrae]RKP54861.1 amidohydrolase [Pararobbsia silviterrae]